MKKISCGFLIESKFGFLALQPYGRKMQENYSYDIPKGEVKENERHLECAVRELKEETGIDLTKYNHKIKDYGVLQYNQYKDIHLYHAYIFDIAENFDFKCSSTFESIYKQSLGQIVPEVIGYKWTYDFNTYFKNLGNMLSKNVTLFNK